MPDTPRTPRAARTASAVCDCSEPEEMQSRHAAASLGVQAFKRGKNAAGEAIRK